MPRSFSELGRLSDIDLRSVPDHESQGGDQDPVVSCDAKNLKPPPTSRVLSEASHETVAARLFDATTSHPFGHDRPFRKWVGSLRKQRPERTSSLTVRNRRWDLEGSEGIQCDLDKVPRKQKRKGHEKSASWSPFGMISVSRNAADPALAKSGSQSRKRRGVHFGRGNGSSRVSDATLASSIDENPAYILVNDAAASERAAQRSRILDELLNSEDSYIADLKVLLYVYVFIHDSAPKIAQTAQPGISQNVSEMLHLHEEMLLQMRSHVTGHGALKRSGHRRWPSIDTLESVIGEKATYAVRRSLDVTRLGRLKHYNRQTSPQEVAKVARVFDSMLPRFFLYEEYGAKYESMLQSIGSLSKTLPTWSTYERGIESLVNSLLPRNGGTLSNKKGLTFEDLLIKPIQRVCRYPLLFAELCKSISTTDDPESKAEVEKVYMRLRETTYEINKATNDQQAQAKIQRTWHLQDLLAFPETCPAPFSLRLLGHATLCGVLFVAYQSKNDAVGNYMFCALFISHLLLASPKAGRSTFEIVAIISLSDVQIDKADSGKGLQCHTAPFSWKLVFASDQQLFELLVCACSAREEQQWKASIVDQAAYVTRHGDSGSSKISLLSFENSVLCLDIKSLGPVFGLPGTLMRRQSFQRAATVNRRKDTYQVIIKNTHSLKDTSDNPVKRTGTLSRSRSLMSTNYVPLLDPRRSERQRMEQRMSDVWTKDRLPYPGMTGHRSGHLIRASATSVMRKISLASIAPPVGLARRRTTTTGSFIEGRPDLVVCDHGNGSQIDGASSPPGEDIQSHSTPAWSTAEYEDPNPYVKRMSSTAKEDTSLQQNTDEEPEDEENYASRHASGTSTVLTSQDQKELNHKKGKPSKQKILMKAFSVEGIRGWFH